MKINVQAPNFAAKEELLVFVDKKLSKLEQFYDRIIFADVFLKLLPSSEKVNKSVKARNNKLDDKVKMVVPITIALVARDFSNPSVKKVFCL